MLSNGNINGGLNPNNLEGKIIQELTTRQTYSNKRVTLQFNNEEILPYEKIGIISLGICEIFKLNTMDNTYYIYPETGESSSKIGKLIAENVGNTIDIFLVPIKEK